VLNKNTGIKLQKGASLAISDLHLINKKINACAILKHLSKQIILAFRVFLLRYLIKQLNIVKHAPN
jgi:hypothetical protein